nr:flagellar biosynthesis protein FlgA [Deltaproteobacteria bacterium]
MNLYRLLEQRENDGRPVRVGVIGAGIYGSMFLSQLRFTPGMKLVGVADLDVEKARD